MKLENAVLIFNAILAILLFGGSGYAVFVLGHSPWWFLGAIVAYFLFHNEVTYKKFD